MTAEPNADALEMTACMLYKMSSEGTPARWRAAWEHLHPDVRAEYRQAARKIITTYLDFLPAWTIDETALEIAQSEARRMPTADGFKTMARHLVTTYELHRQAGTRAAPPVEPPGGEAMTTPGQKAHETALAKIREAAADNEASPGMSQDYADGYANALDKITEILDSCTTQQDPTPAPLGADQKMKISAVRKAHKIETRRNIFTLEEWLHCTCGWTSAKVLAEGMNWETEKLLHTVDALAEE